MVVFCGTASAFSKAAFVLLLLAIAIHCAGYATPGWMKSHSVSDTTNLRVGLWKISNCSSNLPCVESSIPETYKTDLLTATQACESATLIFIVMTAVISFFYVTSPAARIQEIAASVLIMSFASLTLSLTGTIIWVINLPANHYPYISTGLTVVAACLCMLSGVLMIPDVRRFDYDGIKNRKIKKRENKKQKKKLKKKEKWQIPVEEEETTSKF